MSAIALPQGAVVPSLDLPSAVSINKLIAVYLIVPVAMLVMLADYFFHGIFRFLLPAKPESWILWTYIFGLPHLIAGTLMLADREYAAYFGSKLWIGALVILALPFVLLEAAGASALFFVFGIMLVHHTVAQQFGIALIIGKRKPDWLHRVNKYAACAAGLIPYCFIYADGMLRYQLRQHLGEALLVAWGLVGLVVVLTAIQIWQTKPRRGQFYMMANALFVVTMVGVFAYGLGVFAIIMARVIHEMSAWLIYASHDKNRNSQEMHNLVYRRFEWLRLDPFWIGMVLAFVFGVALTFLADRYRDILFTFVISFSLYHYWVEGHVWKGDAPPKKYLRFV